MTCASQQLQHTAPELAAMRGKLRTACGSLHGASDILDQLCGLFSAVTQLGDDSTKRLARLGWEVADTWADQLGSGHDRAMALADHGQPPEVASELQRLSGSMQGGAAVLERLRGLFAAIGKLGNHDTKPLAELGQGVAFDWAELLDTSGAQAFAAAAPLQPTAAPADPAPAPAPAEPAPAAQLQRQPLICLPMDAFDSTTLHLDKAQTLAEMLDLMGPERLCDMTPAGLSGALATLHLELIEVSNQLASARVARGAA